MPSPRLANQLEPAALIDSFLAHPPQDFRAWLAGGDVPVFAADYDLLTTLDDALRRTLTGLPLARVWRRWLRPHTCFVGTTVSEYCLLPTTDSPEHTLAALKQELAGRFSFLILKDLPQASPLLPEADNARSAAVLAAARAAGFVVVEGQALAYVTIDFTTLEDYWARLSAGRRKDLRRKLRAQDTLVITDIPTGHAMFDAAIIDECYRLYENVYAQSDVHFDKLTRDFFAALLTDPASGGVVFQYRHRDELIGFNLCYVSDGKLIDKYVGFRYPAAREFNLYFVSWFHNLGYALQQGLTHYVAGWTDPEVKRALGAQFTFTCHAVHVRNPLVRTLLKPFASLFERDARALQQEDSAKQDGAKR